MENTITWRNYSGLAGDPHKLLIAECNGAKFYYMYNEWSLFNWSMKRAKRKIMNSIKLMQ